jgi:hypothetical protein
MIHDIDVDLEARDTHGRYQIYETQQFYLSIIGSSVNRSAIGNCVAL